MSEVFIRLHHENFTTKIKFNFHEKITEAPQFLNNRLK